MYVLKRSSTGYKQDPTKFFKFSKYEKQCGDFVLIEAAFEKAHQWEQFNLNEEELKKIKKKKIVRLEFEEPNKFFIGDFQEDYDKDFYRIFTLCPYTAKWLNSKYKVKRRIPIFFPFNKEYIPPKTKKIYDVIYTGHIVSGKLLDDLKTISKFNYRLVSNSKNPLVTNHGASYEEKMKLISQTKMTLVHNTLFPRPYHIFNVWRIPDFRRNEAFKLFPKRYQLWRLFGDKKICAPQLKSRVFEAAFGRSLILCKRDPFNVIENYFTPGKEFVYFEEGGLEEKIKEVLANFKKYEPIIERAYKRAVKNYTTEKFVQTYLKKLK